MSPLSEVNVPKLYYFGCYGGTGHYMHDVHMNRDWEFCKTNTWGYHVDGGLAPGSEAKNANKYKDPEYTNHYNREGSAKLHHKDGWTALAWWDRSVDSRPGSNSVILAEGQFTEVEMVGFLFTEFKRVWNRIKYPINCINGMV